MDKKSVNILLTLAYDGSEYCGWQRQKNGIAVQHKLEDSLCTLFGYPISVTGASRTDAGVHALGQRAAFSLNECKIPIAKLPQVINAKLPQNISVMAAEVVSDEFHPRFDAIEKTYAYTIHNHLYANPLRRNFTWHVVSPLDREKMLLAAQCLIGTYDFSSFCAAGGNSKTKIRTIYAIDVESQALTREIIISIRGNGFLYNMVRIMVGTLTGVGCGKISISQVKDILYARDRKLAGKTAPPQGLTLMSIRY